MTVTGKHQEFLMCRPMVDALGVCLQTTA